MKPHKFYIVILLLFLSIVFVFAVPRAKHEGTNFIPQLQIPHVINEWSGEDITEKMNLNLQADEYNFISAALAHNYMTKNGKNLLFIILDAGNFHHPKVCFTAVGFEIKDMEDTEFYTSNRTIKAHTLFTKRGKDSFLSFYWIVINKKVAHLWVEQKIKQLYFSLFSKKRVGLMIRLDIPAKEHEIDDALILAKKFVKDLGGVLQPEQADYILGNI